MNRVLILGASGFIGRALYKELLPFYDVYGTYCSPNHFFEQNQVFYPFNAEKDSLEKLLKAVEPSIIISSLRGNFDALLKAHQELINYVGNREECRLLFLSSVRVFDGIFHYPSYENDKPLATSNYGKYKITVEKAIADLPSHKYAILRLPMVLGVNAPKMLHLKQAIKNKAHYEVYPNLVLNITSDVKLSQKIHYIINRKKWGIFHLGSTDLIHHSDLFEEIIKRSGWTEPVFTHYFDTNLDRFLAVLPRHNKLPENHQFTVSSILDEITFNSTITTIKETLQ